MDIFGEVHNHTTFVFYSTSIGALMLLAAILIESTFISSPAAVWGTYSNRVLAGALAFGITQGLGVFSFSRAIRMIGGPMGGALAAFEPLTAVVFGTIFFSEVMAPACILGCILILGSTVYLSISKLRPEKKAQAKKGSEVKSYS